MLSQEQAGHGESISDKFQHYCVLFKQTLDRRGYPPANSVLFKHQAIKLNMFIEFKCGYVISPNSKAYACTCDNSDYCNGIEPNWTINTATTLTRGQSSTRAQYEPVTTTQGTITIVDLANRGTSRGVIPFSKAITICNVFWLLWLKTSSWNPSNISL